MQEDEEPLSPPPFYRVSGHFTALNPSRPMALAKYFAETTMQEPAAVTSPENAPKFEVPHLVFDDKSNQINSWYNDWLLHEQTPNYAAVLPPNDLGVSASSMAQNSNIFKSTRPHESVDPSSVPNQDSASSLRMIQTPEGLALLLKSSTNQQQFLASTTNSIRPRRHARWTPEEDELLCAAVELEEGPPHNWKRIAKKYFLDRRNALACKGRWNKVNSRLYLISNRQFPARSTHSLLDLVVQNLQPGLVHDKWTAEEDEIVLRGHKDGLSWPEIADMLHGRPPEQVRNRFLNDIDPTLNRAPFTESERRKVYDLQAQYGNKWTQIASEMPGRSEKMVKNCWFNAKMSHSRKLRRVAKEES